MTAISYFGNIETSTREVRPYGAVFRVNRGGTWDMDSLDGLVKITPLQVVPFRIAYDYRSLSGKPLRKVIDYKFRWEIEFVFLGKEELYGVKYLEELWEMRGHTFGNTVSYKQKIYFTPQGERFRNPSFEVVKVSDFEIAPGYYGEKLIGHSNVKWIIETVNTYKSKRMPTVPEPITTLFDSGVFGRGWATSHLEIYS